MINGGAQYTHSFITNPSKPQVELFNLVKQIDICPILNFAVKEVNKCIDIALPHRKIAIEYDGSYWHQDEEKDKQRQKQIESLGWKFIRYRDRVPSLDELRLDIQNLYKTL
jgi:G:T-mismatch repair DNA endonuclease (very short patch repair protein)